MRHGRGQGRKGILRKSYKTESWKHNREGDELYEVNIQVHNYTTWGNERSLETTLRCKNYYGPDRRNLTMGGDEILG